VITDEQLKEWERLREVAIDSVDHSEHTLALMANGVLIMEAVPALIADVRSLREERDEARRKHVRCESEWEELRDVELKKQRTPEQREWYVCDRFYGNEEANRLFPKEAP